jgi:hypothetical protein
LEGKVVLLLHRAASELFDRHPYENILFLFLALSCCPDYLAWGQNFC